MAILSKTHKPGNVESRTSLMLNCTNLRGLRSNLAGWKFLFESISPESVAVYETNLYDSTSNVSLRVCPPLIQTVFVPHMHVL